MIVSVLLFPAASNADTVMTFEPALSAIDALHAAVPVAVPDCAVAALNHVTVATPTLSLAVPPTVIGELDAVKVGMLVGDVIVITGGVASPETGV